MPLVNRITQCYLSPNIGDCPAFTLTGQVSTQQYTIMYSTETEVNSQGHMRLKLHLEAWRWHQSQLGSWWWHQSRPSTPLGHGGGISLDPLGSRWWHQSRPLTPLGHGGGISLDPLGSWQWHQSRPPWVMVVTSVSTPLGHGGESVSTPLGQVALLVEDKNCLSSCLRYDKVYSPHRQKHYSCMIQQRMTINILHIRHIITGKQSSANC